MRIAVSFPEAARITTGPLVASSMDDERLLEQLVRRDEPELVLEWTAGRTEHGWPFTLVRAAQGSERRIAVMFRFVEWRGFVLVQFDEAALAPLIDAAVHAATPDWHGDGEVHCVADLFE